MQGAIFLTSDKKEKVLGCAEGVVTNPIPGCSTQAGKCPALALGLMPSFAGDLEEGLQMG